MFFDGESYFQKNAAAVLFESNKQREKPLGGQKSIFSSSLKSYFKREMQLQRISGWSELDRKTPRSKQLVS